MSETMQVRVPNIGDFGDVEVIELLVKEGDAIEAEQSLITVESDKASMEIPSPSAGVVKKLLLGLGDKVSEGSPILELEPKEGATTPAAGAAEAQERQQPTSASAAPQAAPVAAAPAAAAPAAAEGARARPAAPAFEAAAPEAAALAPGRQAPEARAPGGPAPVEQQEVVPAPSTAPTPTPTPTPRQPSPTAAFETDRNHIVKPHASPSVRKFARELGVDLARVRGSGPRQRILHEDVREWVKQRVQGAGDAAPTAEAGAALGLLPWPKVDFARFGPVETKPLERIRRIAAANLHRNWVMIPHVTNHDDADVTELEAFRLELNREQEKRPDGVKVTLLAFLIKGCVAALQRFPQFNSSLDGESLVLKRYFHIGFAADTPNGLVVPVLRDADRKGVLQIARETAELATRAREGKLSPGEMQGGTFSISSLGGIGGTYFTPIINAPEVAILGVCRAAMRPTWDGKGFQPRLILPLSLSWDHRVVDGAAAARFNAYLAGLLADFRRALL